MNREEQIGTVSPIMNQSSMSHGLNPLATQDDYKSFMNRKPQPVPTFISEALK